MEVDRTCWKIERALKGGEARVQAKYGTGLRLLGRLLKRIWASQIRAHLTPTPLSSMSMGAGPWFRGFDSIAILAHNYEGKVLR